MALHTSRFPLREGGTGGGCSAAGTAVTLVHGTLPHNLAVMLRSPILLPCLRPPATPPAAPPGLGSPQQGERGSSRAAASSGPSRTCRATSPQVQAWRSRGAASAGVAGAGCCPCTHAAHSSSDLPSWAYHAACWLRGRPPCAPLPLHLHIRTQGQTLRGTHRHHPEHCFQFTQLVRPVANSCACRAHHKPAPPRVARPRRGPRRGLRRHAVRGLDRRSGRGARSVPQRHHQAHPRQLPSHPGQRRLPGG